MGIEDQGLSSEEMREILETHREELKRVLKAVKGKKRKKKFLKRLLKFFPISFIINYLMKRMAYNIIIPWVEIKIEECEQAYKSRKRKKEEK